MCVILYLQGVRKYLQQKYYLTGCFYLFSIKPEDITLHIYSLKAFLCEY